MILQTDKDLKMLCNNEKIPETAICYGRKTDGNIGWAGPGQMVGRRWNKYSINSPSIILVKRDPKT